MTDTQMAIDPPMTHEAKVRRFYDDGEAGEGAGRAYTELMGNVWHHGARDAERAGKSVLERSHPRTLFDIVDISTARRETIHLGVKCLAGLRPRDTRFEPRDCVPPIVTPSKRRRFPQNGASRVVEPGRRHPNDGERDSINPNRGTQDSPVAREKVLPEPITDDRDCVVSGCILLGHEPSSQYRLCAEG